MNSLLNWNENEFNNKQGKTMIFSSSNLMTAASHSQFSILSLPSKEQSVEVPLLGSVLFKDGDSEEIYYFPVL